MSTINERFGENLKKIRKQRGLSQQELAEKAHVDLTTVNKLENGMREPMLKSIVKLARALGVTSGEIFPF